MASDLDSSDLRAVAIFGGYLSTCGLLTGIIVKDLMTQRSKLKNRVPSTPILVFAVCATVSIGVTWYYMLSFFGLSYRAWALQHGINLPIQPHNVKEVRDWVQTIHLGTWLKDVQLFREAWETAMESPGRLFWSQPIFFITAMWAFFIGDQVCIRKIKHGWMYMVLGQIVAISFAQCLFYLAVTLSEPTTEDNDSTGSDKARSKKMSSIPSYHASLRCLILALVGIPVVMIPSVIHTPWFLWMLAIPHLALLLPPIVDHLLVTQSLSAEERATVQAVNARMYRFIALVALIAQANLIISVRSGTMAPEHLHQHSAVYVHPILETKPSTPSNNAFYGILASLYDHPAVISVGMDSILCVLNYQVWLLLEHRQ